MHAPSSGNILDFSFLVALLLPEAPLQCLFVPEEWSQQHETTNKLAGCLSARFPISPFHSLLAGSDIQVWRMVTDKPGSAQGRDLSLTDFPH